MFMLPKRHRGFTIVELLIVMVVIAVLAAIVTVAYRSFKDRAENAVITSDLTQAAKQLGLDKALSDTYPPTTIAANEGRGLSSSSGVSYQYATTGSAYCLTATKGNRAYYITETSVPTEGTCSEHANPGGVVPLLFISPNESRNAAGPITLHANTNASVVPFDGGSAWLLEAGSRVRLPASLPWYASGDGAPFGVYIRMTIDAYPETTYHLLEHGSGSGDWPATAWVSAGPTGIRSSMRNEIWGAPVQIPEGQPISLYMGRSQGAGKNHRTSINGGDYTGTSSNEVPTRWVGSGNVLLVASNGISARVAAVIWFDRPLTTEEVARLDGIPTANLTWASVLAR